MNTVRNLIRENLEKNLNLLIESEKKDKYSEDDVLKLFSSQWCNEFDRIRRLQMVMGTFRYGNYKSGKSLYDRIGSAIERLKLYQLDGNLTHLCDVANMCMIEFDVPNNSKAHITHIDDGIHAKKITIKS